MPTLENKYKEIYGDFELDSNGQPKYIWMDSNGVRYTMPQLQDSHLQNLINLSERHDTRFWEFWGTIFKREHQRRETYRNPTPTKKNQVIKKDTSMNLQTAAALADPSLTTVKCKFSKHDTDFYTYKATKKLAETLAVGDTLLVESSGYTYKTAIVVEIHELSELNPRDELEYRYAFQKVDKDLLSSLNQVEDYVADSLYKHQQQNDRNSVLAALGITTEGFKALSDAARTNVNKENT